MGRYIGCLWVLRVDFGIFEFEGMWIGLVWIGGVWIGGEVRSKVR